MSFSITPEGEVGWVELGFKKGDYIVCVSKDFIGVINDFWDEKLTIGKTYLIIDTEWRYWDKVCVFFDDGISGFVSVKFFYNEKSFYRDKKINNILNEGI